MLEQKGIHRNDEHQIDTEQTSREVETEQPEQRKTAKQGPSRFEPDTKISPRESQWIRGEHFERQRVLHNMCEQEACGT